MKKLQLKIKDLTNPSFLNYHEIKNILGGEGSGGSGMNTYNCGFYNESGTGAHFTCDGNSWQDCYDATFELCTNYPMEVCEMAYCNH